MNELQAASNKVELEKIEAEENIVEINDQMYKMKYDEVLRHKFVYDNLLANYEDANTKPKNHIPVLLPRRKDLNYTADLVNAN